MLKEDNILDGILISNVMVNEANNMKNELVIFKVDFEKLYDLVEWDYLDSVMADGGNVSWNVLVQPQQQCYFWESHYRIFFKVRTLSGRPSTYIFIVDYYWRIQFLSHWWFWLFFMTLMWVRKIIGFLICDLMMIHWLWVK